MKRNRKNFRSYNKLVQHVLSEYQPLYLNAMEWYKNIKWDIVCDKDEYRDFYGRKNVNNHTIGYVIAINKYCDSSKYDSTWYITNNLDPKDENAMGLPHTQINDYNKFILALHDILNYGLIRPDTKEIVWGTP